MLIRCCCLLRDDEINTGISLGKWSPERVEGKNRQRPRGLLFLTNLEPTLISKRKVANGSYSSNGNETYLGQSQSPFFISMSSRPTRFFGGGGGCFTFGGGFLITGGGRLGSIGTELNFTTS